MKTKSKPQKRLRAKKWVVWLRNHTNKDDDETVTVSAKTAQEAQEKVRYDDHRFSIRAVIPLTDWKKYSYWG